LSDTYNKEEKLVEKEKPFKSKKKAKVVSEL